MKQVVIVGAGMGGLAAALRLARAGHRVRLFEARPSAGGLAGGFEAVGLRFDAGPYVLLDRPGLQWAFETLAVELPALQRVEHVYDVLAPGAPVEIHADVERTAAGLERAWPGSGARYRAFVDSVAATYRRLRPLLLRPRPGPLALLGNGGWREIPFLLRSLDAVLGAARLPAAVTDALAIWTHVAGQQRREAPSPMAFVAALIHDPGAFVPAGGIDAVPRALAAAAIEAGVEIEYATRVTRIRCAGGVACGVETAAGCFHAADAVVSNANGVGTYLGLVQPTPVRLRAALERLPLQSPGVCAYLGARRWPGGAYLRFRLDADTGCRLLVHGGAVAPATDGWFPARLIAPLDHARAQALGRGGQHEVLERLLDEAWWREGLGEVRVIGRRVPAEWGAEYLLYRDSMNPVMTARLMRSGRLAHRSPYVRRLYLAGSATHPGQWVSFCAISGILAADLVGADLR